MMPELCKTQCPYCWPATIATLGLRGANRRETMYVPLNNNEEIRMIKAGIDQDAIITIFSQATAKQGDALRKSVGDATLKAVVCPLL